MVKFPGDIAISVDDMRKIQHVPFNYTSLRLQKIIATGEERAFYLPVSFTNDEFIRFSAAFPELQFNYVDGSFFTYTDVKYDLDDIERQVLYHTRAAKIKDMGLEEDISLMPMDELTKEILEELGYVVENGEAWIV